MLFSLIFFFGVRLELTEKINKTSPAKENTRPDTSIYAEFLWYLMKLKNDS